MKQKLFFVWIFIATACSGTSSESHEAATSGDGTATAGGASASGALTTPDDASAFTNVTSITGDVSTISGIAEVTGDDSTTSDDASTNSGVDPVTGDGSTTSEDISGISGITEVTGDDMATSDDASTISGVAPVMGDESTTSEDVSGISGVTEVTGDDSTISNDASTISSVTPVTGDGSTTSEDVSGISSVTEVTGDDSATSDDASTISASGRGMKALLDYLRKIDARIMKLEVHHRELEEEDRQLRAQLTPLLNKKIGIEKIIDKIGNNIINRTVEEPMIKTVRPGIDCCEMESCADYRGTQNATKAKGGRSCFYWDMEIKGWPLTYNRNNSPDLDLMANYCRSVSGRDPPACYTSWYMSKDQERAAAILRPCRIRLPRCSELR